MNANLYDEKAQTIKQLCRCVKGLEIGELFRGTLNTVSHTHTPHTHSTNTHTREGTEGDLILRRGEGNTTTKAEIGAMSPQAEQCQPPPEARRYKDQITAQSPQSKHGPADTLISAQRNWRWMTGLKNWKQIFVDLSPQMCGTMWWQPQEIHRGGRLAIRFGRAVIPQKLARLEIRVFSFRELLHAHLHYKGVVQPRYTNWSTCFLAWEDVMHCDVMSCRIMLCHVLRKYTSLMTSFLTLNLPWTDVICPYPDLFIFLCGFLPEKKKNLKLTHSFQKHLLSTCYVPETVLKVQRWAKSDALSVSLRRGYFFVTSDS